MNTINSAVDFLYQTILQDTTTGAHRLGFLQIGGSAKPFVRELGIQLNKEGGFHLMKMVSDALIQKIFKLRDSDEDLFELLKSDLRGLDFAWNGIGGWRS